MTVFSVLYSSSKSLYRLSHCPFDRQGSEAQWRTRCESASVKFSNRFAKLLGRSGRNKSFLPCMKFSGFEGIDVSVPRATGQIHILGKNSSESARGDFGRVLLAWTSVTGQFNVPVSDRATVHSVHPQGLLQIFWPNIPISSIGCH